MGATQAAPGFLSPFAVEAPPGAEGWQRLYPYYYLFSEARREFEEEKFWFFDGMHNPEPVYPFDTIMTESWWVALNQFGTRVYVIPPALGIDQRIVNGYLFISPNSITDPELIASLSPSAVVVDVAAAGAVAPGPAVYGVIGDVDAHRFAGGLPAGAGGLTALVVNRREALALTGASDADRAAKLYERLCRLDPWQALGCGEA